MKVSIITVTYNSGKTVKDTLESVCNQSYSDIEHIIIDGASKDDTLDIVNEYTHVARVISESDDGIYDAMNKGIRLATGDVIGILNSDDIFYDNNVLEKVMSAFERETETDAVYGNIVYFKEAKDEIVRKWKSKAYYENFFNDGLVPPHPSLFVRRKVYDELDLYYPNFKISSDYEFMFRMMKVNKYKTQYLDTNIVNMRVGGISTSGLKSYLIATKELKQSWEMNGYKYPLKLYMIRPIIKRVRLRIERS